MSVHLPSWVLVRFAGTALAWLLLSGWFAMPVAYALNGDSLLRWCADSRPAVTATPCIAYIEGVIAGVQAQQQAQMSAPPFCVPPATPMEQQVQRVVKHLQSRPEDMLLDAGFLTYRALRRAYPCPLPAQVLNRPPS